MSLKARGAVCRWRGRRCAPHGRARQHLALGDCAGLAIALFAQLVMQTVYSRSSRVPAKMSGYAVARQVLDGSGLYDVEIEQVPGPLSNHFDVRRRVLQLSPDVYHGRHLMAAGIAAHEAGHAIQAARGFRLLAIREVAVPAAVFGSGAGILVAVVGLIVRFPPFMAVGILLFGGVLVVQLVNLPVELHASGCARACWCSCGSSRTRQRRACGWCCVRRR